MSPEMEKERIDKLIVQVRLSCVTLTIASLIIVSISFIIGRGIAQKATSDLEKLITVQASWPKSLPKHFSVLVSDLTIGSEHFKAYMGYVALHGSSPFSEKYSGEKLFLSTEKHNTVILDASAYQKSALNDLQLLFSSPPVTLKDFQNSWDHLAFPVYFMQFSTLINWYLGVPDETNIVWWEKLERDGYIPVVPLHAYPEKPITLSISNKDSQWDVMGNIWRGEDSSSEMKGEITKSEGWFLYKEYKVNGKSYKLLGVLGKPVLKKYSPLKYIPGHGFDTSQTMPFSIAFPWISEYGGKYDQANLFQLKQFLAIKEESESKEVSLFGVSMKQKHVILFAVPVLLIFQIQLLAQLYNMISFYQNITQDRVIESEPWLLFSNSRVSFYYYIIATYILPVVAAFTSAFSLVKYSDTSIFLALIMPIVIASFSVILIRKSSQLIKLRSIVLINLI